MIVLNKQAFPTLSLSPAIRYDIVDKQSGKVVGTAKTRAGATRSADRRDNAYGAYRYSVRAVYE